MADSDDPGWENEFGKEHVEVRPPVAAESFRQGWKEAMRGETLPIDRLWDGIDVE